LGVAVHFAARRSCPFPQNPLFPPGGGGKPRFKPCFLGPGGKKTVPFRGKPETKGFTPATHLMPGIPGLPARPGAADF